MRRPDPERLPAPGGFQSTAWTVIRHAQAVPTAQRRDALDHLLALYWRPVYWTMRTRWNAGPEDARDLTQEYFATFLEKRLILKAAREKGSFRSFVKGTLKKFMLMRRRSGRSVKRGGRVRIVALDNLSDVEKDASRADESPETRFDRELMRSVFAECLSRLERDCRAERRPERFRLFQAYYMGGDSGEKPTYASLRKRFGMDAHEIKNALHALRDRFRKSILEALKDGTSSEEELVAEMSELFGNG